MLYTYTLGCGIACLVFAGVSAMDAVEVRPARLAAQVLLWPAALLVWLLDRHDTHRPLGQH